MHTLQAEATVCHEFTIAKLDNYPFHLEDIGELKSGVIEPKKSN